MVDRKARNRLGEVIDDYLEERIMAFEFDEQINSNDTQDESVLELTGALWCFYDDLEDHQVVLGKQEWNFFQRILLFLKTDNEISDKYSCEFRSISDWTQWIALAALVIQILLLVLYFDHVLFIVLMGGFISLPIELRRMHLQKLLISPEERKAGEWMDLNFYPFSSTLEMLRAARKTGFRKQPYPERLTGRRIRSEYMEDVITVNSNIYEWWFHFIFSPFKLLSECSKISALATKKETP